MPDKINVPVVIVWMGPRSRWPDRSDPWSDEFRAHTCSRGALELHGLEKASSALLSGQWSGTCLIRGHFVLGRSDQRQFQCSLMLHCRFSRWNGWIAYFGHAGSCNRQTCLDIACFFVFYFEGVDGEPVLDELDSMLPDIQILVIFCLFGNLIIYI